MIALVFFGFVSLFETVGWGIQKTLGSAVPVCALEAQYGGEGLTVSKCAHQVVKPGALPSSIGEVRIAARGHDG